MRSRKKLVDENEDVLLERAKRDRTTGYRPDSDPYASETEILREFDHVTDTWSYGSPWSWTGYCVARFDWECGKDYRVLSYYNGAWYMSLPEPPYELYGAFDLAMLSTVYVCEGEKTTEAAKKIGLHATTSLGGPRLASRSDWSPLAHKQVVILRDFDDEGLQYARDVGQLVLAAGAASAKIVTLPGLKEHEDLVEWIEARQGRVSEAAMRGGD